jgi:hypothetical protein
MNVLTPTPIVEISPAFEFIKKINIKLDNLRDILKTVSQPLQEKPSEDEQGQPTELLGELNQIDIKIAKILDCVVI